MKTNRSFAAACMIGVALTVAGCGTSDVAAPQLPTATVAPNRAETPTDAPGATDRPPSSDPEEAQAQFERCLADHGVKGQGATVFDATDPQTDGTSFSISHDDEQPAAEEEPVTEEALNAALAECEPYLDAAFGDETVDPAVEAEMADRNLATLECLRDAGFDVEVDANGTMNYEVPPGQDPSVLDEINQKCAG